MVFANDDGDAAVVFAVCSHRWHMTN